MHRLGQPYIVVLPVQEELQPFPPAAPRFRFALIEVVHGDAAVEETCDEAVEYDVDDVGAVGSAASSRLSGERV